jgi:hypothetical protein
VLESTPYQSILLRGAVVGVVSRQHTEIDVADEMSVDFLDDGQIITIIGLVFVRDMQVTEVDPTEAFMCCFA